jgi:antitoxin component of MazEF toxin-antitoxin module
MPFVSSRRIIQVGGSKTVAVPPAWLDACELDLGDKVLLVADGAVLIVPPGMRLTSKQLEPLIEIVNRSAAK